MGYSLPSLVQFGQHYDLIKQSYFLKTPSLVQFEEVYEPMRKNYF